MDIMEPIYQVVNNFYPSRLRRKNEKQNSLEKIYFHMTDSSFLQHLHSSCISSWILHINIRYCQSYILHILHILPILHIFCIYYLSISAIVNHRSPEAAQYTHPSLADKCPKWLIDLWIKIDCLTFPFANRDLKKNSNRFLNILLGTAEAGRHRMSWGKWLMYSMNTAITFVEYYSIQIHQLTFKFFQLSSSEMKVIHCWWPQ